MVVDVEFLGKVGSKLVSSDKRRSIKRTGSLVDQQNNLFLFLFMLCKITDKSEKFSNFTVIFQVRWMQKQKRCELTWRVGVEPNRTGS